MASEPYPTKQHRYDLSMSRRTRKPQITAKSSLDQEDKLKNDSNGIQGIHHSSLKELMNQGYGEEKANGATGQSDAAGGENKEGVAEKSQLALVLKQGEGKKGGMVSRYVKVLSHLVKVKRDSKKRSAVRLLVQ